MAAAAPTAACRVGAGGQRIGGGAWGYSGTRCRLPCCCVCPPARAQALDPAAKVPCARPPPPSRPQRPPPVPQRAPSERALRQCASTSMLGASGARATAPPPHPSLTALRSAPRRAQRPTPPRAAGAEAPGKMAPPAGEGAPAPGGNGNGAPKSIPRSDSIPCAVRDDGAGGQRPAIAHPTTWRAPADTAPRPLPHARRVPRNPGPAQAPEPDREPLCGGQQRGRRLWCAAASGGERRRGGAAGSAGSAPAGGRARVPGGRECGWGGDGGGAQAELLPAPAPPPPPRRPPPRPPPPPPPRCTAGGRAAARTRAPPARSPSTHSPPPPHARTRSGRDRPGADQHHEVR